MSSTIVSELSNMIHVMWSKSPQMTLKPENIKASAIMWLDMHLREIVHGSSLVVYVSVFILNITHSNSSNSYDRWKVFNCI